MRRRVWVTGVGAGVGQGILIALQKKKFRYKIFASDASPFATGLYLTKLAFVTGKLETELEFERFIDLIRNYRIEVIFPGNEYDLVTLSNKKKLIQERTSAIVICSNPEVIQITNDKWLTYEFCLQNGIPTPKTFLVDNQDIFELAQKTMALPWVVKPRFGTASRGITYVHNYEEARSAIQSVDNPLIQEFLRPKNADFTSEYTCSIFKDKQGMLQGPFIAERNLKGGSTWIAKVVANESLHGFLFKIAQSLDYSGPLNIQLIDTPEGPKILELNCRFSGTTGIRSHFGFNEPDMSVKSFLLGKRIRSVKIREGLVLRHITDVVLKSIKTQNPT
jgi:carbamoyl-phosphate synthase large subunit